MNKIKEYKGYGNYTSGVSKYSNTTSVYLFDIQETGNVNEHGEKEYSYKLYEFLSSILLQEARRLFINDYMEYLGYTTQAIIQIMSQGTSSTEYSNMIYAKVKSYKLADTIYKPNTLDYAKEVKIYEITAYDESKAVNQFYLSGIGMWYKADKRATIRNLVESNIRTCNDRVTLWTEEEPIVGLEFNCEEALMMLAQLEVYAGNCKAVTQQHKANVMALTTKEEIEAYDYTTGYPEKLNLNTSAV